MSESVYLLVVTLSEERGKGLMFQLSYKAQRYVILFGFLTVPLLLLFTFSVYPALALFYFSLTDWDGLGFDMKWIGLQNYKEIFSQPDIFAVFRTNLYYFFGGLIQTAVALWFAVILSERLRGRYFFRVILFLPYILHSVATVIMFKNVYHAEYGQGGIGWMTSCNKGRLGRNSETVAERSSLICGATVRRASTRRNSTLGNTRIRNPSSSPL